MAEVTGRTHATRAVIELRKKILSGELAGGTRLFEVPLAETLQISRTPVREAMSRLAEEGLLDRVESGGFVVRAFGFEDVIDAIELRGVLEGTAARLAAERGAAPEALVRIREIVDCLDTCFGEMPGEVDFERYADLNAQFHEELAGLSRSETVRREVLRSTRLPFASPSAFLPNNAEIAAFRISLARAQDQHREMVNAIAAREGSRAEAIGREHARTARRNLEYIIEKDRALIANVPGLALLVA